jgi:hypothetical protein
MKRKREENLGRGLGISRSDFKKAARIPRKKNKRGTLKKFPNIAGNSKW